MEYFENNRKVNFEDLAQLVDSDGKRVYSEHLLQELKNGNYNALNDLSISNRENRYFMEPLLYAMKNNPRCGTYIVFKYYGENLQEDLGLLIEVVLDDPKIIEGTPISNNKEFMLDIIELKPSVLLYVSDTLKKDHEFIEELQELQDRGVDLCLQLEENPELRSDEKFMKEAIKQDAKLLEFASEELKNNYEFMKDVTKQNYKTVEYVIQNKNDFGLEGIKGAKETTRELTVEDYMAIINELSESSEDNRYKRVKEKVAEKGADDPRAVKWITAMVAQQSDRISPENFKKVFDNAVLTMTKIQKDLTENGEMKISKENAYELIRPQILNNLREAAVSKGLEISQEQEKLFKEYEEFHREYNERLREKKHQEIKKVENDDFEIKPQQIEERTKDARISEINGSTREIREEYTRQTEEKEVINDERGTNEERT